MQGNYDIVVGASSRSNNILEKSGMSQPSQAVLKTGHSSKT
jgi:hypothetical protein